MAAALVPATPAAEALLAALADRPGATATELAQAAEVGRSTAAKLLTALAAQGRVLRQRSGRRAPDRWTLPTAAPIQDPSPPPTTPPALPAEPIPAAEQPPSGAGRLRSGQLRDLVVGCLTERPGHALSPTAIAKRLDRSAGAVANALQVLAGQGAVTQTQTTPRRYTIAAAQGSHTDAQR
jgi:DNA-binding IclR family transcriptional regulator